MLGLDKEIVALSSFKGFPTTTAREKRTFFEKKWIDKFSKAMHVGTIEGSFATLNSGDHFKLLHNNILLTL